MADNYYYHAGVDNGWRVLWSDHTRRTAERAEREALALSRKHGGTPIVEYWDRSWGLFPGDADAVEGAWEVE